VFASISRVMERVAKFGRLRINFYHFVFSGKTFLYFPHFLGVLGVLNLQWSVFLKQKIRNMLEKL